MTFKPPTYLLIRRLAALVGTGTVAKACGKESETVDAWGRPTLSNEHPNGTGKANPLDCVLRLQNLARKEGDEALACEIGELFIDHVEEKPNECLNGLIGSVIKEHSEAIVGLLNNERPDYAAAHTEIVQAEVALRKLKLWVKDELTPTNGNLRAFARKAVADRKR